MTADARSSRTLDPREVRVLRAYALGMAWIGGALLLAIVARYGVSGRDLLLAAVGAVAVGALRLGAVPLSKFSYVTVALVPFGALVLLGEPVAAVLAMAVGTALGDAVRRKGAFALAVNAGREAIAAAASAGVYAAAIRHLGMGSVHERADLLVFRVENIPAGFFFLLAYVLFSRGLFYFSLAYRGKLTAAEWRVLLRYEVITAALASFAALSVAGTFHYFFDPQAWVVILVVITAVGVLARTLIAEAINSEELQKVVAMEAVIASGMSLEESLGEIERLAGRLIDWRWLCIYTATPEGLRLVHTTSDAAAAGLQGAERLREEVVRTGERAVVQDARTDARLDGVTDVRSLVEQPLVYGRTALGLLEIAHHRGGEYGPAEVRLITRFARQLALAVQLDSLVRPMVHTAQEIGDQLAMVGDTVGQLRQNGEGVAEFASEIRHGITEQGNRTGAGLGMTETLAAAASEIAEDALESAERTRDVGRLAGENRAAILQAIQRLVELRDFVDLETRELTQLAAASERISTVVGAIRQIADQTNLLALNASIEAARAGEHGRGFAVVAEEVRKLSEQAAHASEEAARLLDGIQAQGKTAVHRLQQGSESVSGVGEVSEGALRALEKIVQATEGSGELMGRIATRVAEQRAQLAELRDEIAAVAQIAARNGQGATRVAEAVGFQAQSLAEIEGAIGVLRGVSERLSEYMERFTEVR